MTEKDENQTKTTCGRNTEIRLTTSSQNGSVREYKF